ncbi:endothelial differentiation-related factor 1 [Conidiobolus coronatus NRRL 28638]|uniref:Endothelial differentiation-related factor 1 n=1 Tax=Conidiobolus coronatus (strain ATCC 28846 / CBS 209.66 / NRRL 28638) TaxID=796925 RepID=A0A137P525_CONC2|nr:endothelial differentiation-related factor 1 [Conidiobolus coronatus NRRL 28638]|eukprot:KXN70031.1 endothelial differentiation-related factor 1 [Conidiobolus coronatus NRRL 28638]
MSFVDNDIVLHKRKAPAPKVTKSSSDINAARRVGAVVDVHSKLSIGSNKSTPNYQQLYKIDQSNEAVAPPTVSLSVGQAIMKARQAQGLSQKDLAQKINEKPNIINDYEASRGVPNQQVLSKLQRVLNIKLTGKNIGEPMPPRGSKK